MSREQRVVGWVCSVAPERKISAHSCFSLSLSLSSSQGAQRCSTDKQGGHRGAKTSTKKVATSHNTQFEMCHLGLKNKTHTHKQGFKKNRKLCLKKSQISLNMAMLPQFCLVPSVSLFSLFSPLSSLFPLSLFSLSLSLFSSALP